ncbi:MAG: hypothetical protein ACSHYF_18575 [Verrucomicrobiaceae bacterium]
MKLPLLFLLILAPFVHGQDAPPKGYIRFIALGDAPPYKDELVDGVRVEQPAPEGSLPPKDLTVSGAGENGALSLRLRQMTKYVEVQDRTKSVGLFKGEVGAGDPWVTSPGPAVPSTCVIVRSPRERKLSWNDVRKVTLKDDLASFPVESIRLVNMSTSTVAIKIGDGKAFAVGPGRVKVLKQGDGVKVGGDTMVAIAQKKADGSYQKVFNNALQLYSRNRINLFAYNEDGVDARGRIKLSINPEIFKNLAP